MLQSAVKLFVWSVDQKYKQKSSVYHVRSTRCFSPQTSSSRFIFYQCTGFVGLLTERLKLAIGDKTVWLSSPEVWKRRNPASFQRAAAAAGRRLLRWCCLAGSLFGTRSLGDRCWFWESGCRCWLLSHLCICKHIMCLFTWTSQYWLWRDPSPQPAVSGVFSIISVFFLMRTFKFCCRLSLNTGRLSAAAVMMQMGVLPAALNMGWERASSPVSPMFCSVRNPGVPRGGFLAMLRTFTVKLSRERCSAKWKRVVCSSNRCCISGNDFTRKMKKPSLLMEGTLNVNVFM